MEASLNLSSTGLGLSSASGGSSSDDPLWNTYFLGLNVWLWAGLGLFTLVFFSCVLSAMHRKELSFWESIRYAATCSCCCGENGGCCGDDSDGVSSHIQYTRGIVSF